MLTFVFSQINDFVLKTFSSFDVKNISELLQISHVIAFATQDADTVSNTYLVSTNCKVTILPDCVLRFRVG